MIKSCKECEGDIPSSRRSDAIYCSKKCSARYRGRKWEVNNPDKVKASRVKINNRHTDRIFTRLKSKAKKLCVPFDLDRSDIVVPDFCPALGIKLNKEERVRGFSDSAASIDRIDPSKGYTKGNIQIISARANRIKYNATNEELELLLEYMKRKVST